MAREHTQALELAASGQWDRAHEIVQARSDRLACLIHGYLHRVEGDLGNAAYWYRRADEPMPGNSLDEEHQRLSALAAEVETL